MKRKQDEHINLRTRVRDIQKKQRTFKEQLNTVLYGLNKTQTRQLLCRDENGNLVSDTKDGNSKVHHFDIDDYTSAWSKPETFGLEHIDPATSFMVECLYHVISSTERSLCTLTTQAKIHHPQHQGVTALSKHVGGISFQDAIELYYEARNEKFKMKKHKEYLNKLFPLKPLDTQTECAKKLFDYIDEEALTNMFYVHLIARMNDAKADNLKFDIVFDEHGKMTLWPVDIDFDHADGNPIYKKKSGHYCGFKDILCLLTEALDKKVNKNARKHFMNEHAVFKLLDWMQLIYERDVECQKQLDNKNYVEKDFLDANFESAFSLLLKLKPGMIEQVYRDMLNLQDAQKDPDSTHRQLFQSFNKATAAYYEHFEKTVDHPLEAMQKIFGLNTAEDVLKNTGLESNLDSFSTGTYENNEDLRTSSLSKEIASFLSTFELGSLPSLKDQLLFLNQVGDAFPLIQKLNLSEHDRNAFLIEAVRNALPGATRLLIKLGADVNQTINGEPLLHYLVKHYKQEDFDSRVKPTLEALLSCPRININKQDSKGNTATMEFTRMVDIDNHYHIANDIYTILSRNGATLIPTNVRLYHAFDIAYDIRKKPALCKLLLEKFRGRKYNIDATKLASIDLYLNEHYASDKTFYDDCIHDISILQYQHMLDKISSKTPKKGWIEAHGAVSGVRYFNPAYVSDILDENGKIINNEAYFGRRNIARIDDMFFKQDPELPGVEYAVSLFRNMMINHGSPHAELFRIGDTLIQLSTLLHGTNLQHNKGDEKQKDAQTEALGKIDSYSFSGMTMVSMLLNPEDDKPDNFMLQAFIDPENVKKYLISSFDSDHHMVNGMGVVNKISQMPKLLVKSVLFCLDEMRKPLDSQFVKEFLAISPEDFITAWLTDLENNYNKNNELVKGKKKVIPTPFTQNIIDNIYRKFTLAHEKLSKNKQLTALELLKVLEPEVGVRYEKALNKFDDPYVRFNDVTDESYEKTKTGGLTTQLTSSDIMTTNNIDTSIFTDPKKAKKYTPTQAREYFDTLCNKDETIKEVLENIKQGSLDAFNQIQFDSIKEEIISQLDFNNYHEAIQKGIINCLLNKKNPVKFKNLTIKNCGVLDDKTAAKIITSSAHLASINFSGCQNITAKTIDAINKSKQCDVLTKLVLNRTNIEDVSITNLKNINKLIMSDCKNLQFVNTTSTSIKHIIASDCSKLETLTFNSMELKTADVRGCTSLDKNSIANIVLKSALDNIKLDPTHKKFNKRYLTMQAVRQHKWYPKILTLIIDDNGTLDLSGFYGLTCDDFTAIAHHCKDKRVPAIKNIQLKGCNYSHVGLRHLMQEVKTCAQVSVSTQKHDEIKFQQQPTTKTGEIQLEPCLSGEVLDFDPSKTKAVLQLPNGDRMMAAGGRVVVQNGITGVIVSDLQFPQKASVLRKLNQYSGQALTKVKRALKLKTINMKNSIVQLEQLNDHHVLILNTTENKGKHESKLYLADTESFLLSEIPMPKGSDSKAHIAVRSENEVIIGCGDRLTIFNPLTQKINRKMIPESGKRIGQCHYLGKRYVTTLYDEKLFVVDNKKNVAKFYDVSATFKDIQNLKLKDVVYLPGNYIIAYSRRCAFIVDLNNKKDENNIQRLKLPTNHGIESITVDSFGKCHFALKHDEECFMYKADLTSLKLDRAEMTNLFSNLKHRQEEGKLILSGESVSNKHSRTKLTRYFKALFPVTINVRDEQIILHANAECNMSQMVKFVERMKKTQEKKKVVTAHYDRIESPRGMPQKNPQRPFFKQESKKIPLKRDSGWKRRAPSKKAATRAPVKSFGLSRSSGNRK